jgi:hypothetical protein
VAPPEDVEVAPPDDMDVAPPEGIDASAPTSCCEPSTTGGCAFAVGCEDCVCAADPHCCLTKWDSACVVLANQPEFCKDKCGCTCTPDCTGLTCGDDGCGGSCGACIATANCIDGACVALGDTCDTAWAVDGLPFSFFGDTTGASADLETAFPCAQTPQGTAGPDHVFAFTPEGSGHYAIWLLPDAGFDPMLYLLDGCGAEAACPLVSDQLGKGEPEVILLQATALQTIYIVVDHFSNTASAAGAYELRIELVPSEPGNLLINEVDYDQVNEDTTEFVEIYNPGPGPASLAFWTLQHVNGAAGPKVEWQVNLAVAGATLAAEQYLVIGHSAAIDALPAGVASIVNNKAVQNGGADGDGVRLLVDGLFFDGVAYEAALVGTGEGSFAPADSNTEPGSLNRCPNANDSNDNGKDFVFRPTPTPGMANACPPPPTTFADVSPIYQAKCTPCHKTGNSGGHSIGSTDIAKAFGDSQKPAGYNPCKILNLTKGACTIVRIKNGSMPEIAPVGCTGDPAKDINNPKCLTQAQQNLIQAWIEQGQLPPPPAP